MHEICANKYRSAIVFSRPPFSLVLFSSMDLILTADTHDLCARTRFRRPDSAGLRFMVEEGSPRTLARDYALSYIYHYTRDYTRVHIYMCNKRIVLKVDYKLFFSIIF